MISVDCGEMPVAYTEALFFGFVPGFMGWGRTQRHGYLLGAQGATLYLDEVGRLDPDFQTRFSRFLEENRFRLLGSEEETESRFHLISASGTDLSLHVDMGKFSGDLYFRLSQVILDLPPLSSRTGELDHIIRFFLEEIGRIEGIPPGPLSPEAHRLLMEYDFPGDLEELFQILRVALSEANGATITPDHLAPFSPVLRHLSPLSSAKSRSAGLQDLPGIEEIEILNHVNHHGHITNAQCRRILKVDRFRASYLLKKLDAMGILTCVGRGRSAYYTRQATVLS